MATAVGEGHLRAPLALSADASRLGRAGAAAGAFLLVTGTSAARGGYFPTTWGWAGLALAWTCLAALVMGRGERPSRLELGFVAAFLALAAWTATSALWSADVPQTALESQRTLLYAAAALAAATIVRRDAVPAAAAGLLAGIVTVSCYALATRLEPGRIGVFDSGGEYRLAAPLGYWNSLGLLAALGLVLAAGFAADQRGRLGRCLAGAAFVPLATTLYFTLSRGSWGAVAVGFLVALAFAPARLRLIATLAALTPPAMLAVLAASAADGLTRRNAPLAEAAADGRRLVVVLALLALAAAALVAGLGAAERRFAPAARTRRGIGIAVTAVAVAAAGALVATQGPLDLVQRARSSFAAPPRAVAEGADTSARLFSLSNNGRVELWRSAMELRSAHPWTGAGAGTFETHWLATRATPMKVRDAHSLYAEALAELGPLGLGLLGAVVSLPLAAAVRARRRPLVSVLAGAYSAFAVHAGLDWDWEVPAVTLAALAAAGLILAAARDRRSPLPRRMRWTGITVAAALGAAALGGLLGNAAVASAQEAAAEGRWPAAATAARDATRFAPWSSAGWQLVAEAQRARGDRRGAAASLRRALARDPNDWALWYELGIVSDGAPRVNAYRRAAELNPAGRNISVLRTLGVLPDL